MSENAPAYAVFVPLAYLFACAVTSMEYNSKANNASKGMDQRADELLHEKCQQVLADKGNLVAVHKEHQQKIDYIENVNFNIYDGPSRGFKWKAFFEDINHHLATKIDPDGKTPYSAQPYFADHYKITVSLSEDITEPRLTLKNDGSPSLLEINPENDVDTNAAAAAELMTEALNIVRFLQEDSMSDDHAMGTYSFGKDGTVIFADQSDPKTAQVLALSPAP